MIVDSDGFAWYMDFGQQFIGKLDPETGEVTEYPMPLLKPEQPRGGIEVRAGQERESLAGHAIPGSHCEIRQEDAEDSMSSLCPRK